MSNELEVLKQSSHPHVMRAIELLYDDKYYYIVSEILRGGELEDRIDNIYAAEDGNQLNETISAYIVN